MTKSSVVHDGTKSSGWAPGPNRPTSWREGLGRLGPADILLPLIAGLAAGLLFVGLFPGRALSTLMHNVMWLPGPGAGTGMVTGPLIILASLVVYTFRRKPLVAFITALAAGTSQTIGSVYISPGVLTPATVPAAVLSVIVMATVLEACLLALRGLADTFALPAAAVAADLAHLGFQWAAVFPIIKRNVLPDDAALLAGLATAASVLLGALPVLLFRRFLAGPNKPK